MNHLSESHPAAVSAALEEHGWAYIEAVDGNNALIALAEAFGEIVGPGVGMGPQLHDGRVYEVAVREAGKGLTDQHGNTIVSTTAHSFELHTDGYNRPEPPRFVFLLRTDGGVGGPASFVSRSDQAIARLNASTRDALTRAEYPSAAGPIPLLDVPAPSLHRLRFNGTEIEQWSGRGPNPDLGDQQRETLHALAHELRSVRATFTIAPGDCLVLDNWRVCHGRASMSRSSKRVLSRVWVV